MLLLVCRHRGLDMRGGGDGGRFGGVKGGADGLRVELRIFGDAVLWGCHKLSFFVLGQLPIAFTETPVTCVKVFWPDD